MSEKYENPCTPERCDVSHCCSKGTDAGSQTWEYWRTCTTFSLYLGHQEGYAVGESERDALRAEVERYKRALEKAIGLGHYCPPGYTDCDDAGSDIKDCAQCRSEWALTEAGKGEGC